MPHFDYVYHGAAAANCVALGGAAAGNPAPNLQGLAGTAGAALPALGGLPGAGFGAVPAVAGRAPYTWPAITAAPLIIGQYPPGAHPAYEAIWRIANLRMAAHGWRRILVVALPGARVRTLTRARACRLHP